MQAVAPGGQLGELGAELLAEAGGALTGAGDGGPPHADTESRLQQQEGGANLLHELMQVGADYLLGRHRDVLQSQRGGRGRRQRHQPRRRVDDDAVGVGVDGHHVASAVAVGCRHDDQGVGKHVGRPANRAADTQTRAVVFGDDGHWAQPGDVLEAGGHGRHPGSRSGPQLRQVGLAQLLRREMQVVQRHPVRPRRESHRQAVGGHLVDHVHHVVQAVVETEVEQPGATKLGDVDPDIGAVRVQRRGPRPDRGGDAVQRGL